MFLASIPAVILVLINLVSLISLIEHFKSILLAPFRHRPISDIVGLITSLIVPSHILTHFKVTYHPRVLKVKAYLLLL